MSKNAALLLAGLVFSIVALLHLLRLLTGFDLVIATIAVPLWVSGLGLLISLVLALVMFKARQRL